MQGTWQMEEWVDGNGNTRLNPHGLWTFGERHYSYVIVGSLREREPLPPLQTPGQPTEAEKIAFADHMAGFIAQAGTMNLTERT